MTPDQRRLFDYYCAHWRGTADQWDQWLRRFYGVRRICQLPDAQARAALAQLQARKGEAA